MYNIKNILLCKTIIVVIATRVVLCIAIQILNFGLQSGDFTMTVPSVLFWLVIDVVTVWYLSKGYAWARILKVIYIVWHLVLLYYTLSTTYYTAMAQVYDFTIRYALMSICVFLHIVPSCYLIWIVYTNENVRADTAKEVQARKQKKSGSA